MFSGLFFRLTNLRCFFQSLVLFCSLRTAKPWAPRYHKWSTKLTFLASQVSRRCILSLKMSLSNKKDLSLELTVPNRSFNTFLLCAKSYFQGFFEDYSKKSHLHMFFSGFSHRSTTNRPWVRPSPVPDAGARGAASAAAVVGGLCARRAAGGRMPWCRGAVARGTSVG